MPSRRRLTSPSSNDSTSSDKDSEDDLNVLSVVLGSQVIEPWYGSFYRDELAGHSPVERLFVCPNCFKYTRDPTAFLGHQRHCEGDIPGKLIWTKGKYSLYEVDGDEYRLFTQNLSLFAKLFIENKSVCFDVSTFDYYLLIETTTSPIHSDIVGFFSKEKLSWDNNNLACILVFPPWQKKGLGQMLMDASYKISKREGRRGGPERPLSELGRKSYMSYWCRAVAIALLTRTANRPVTVNALSDSTNMMPDDVVNTLIHMGVLGDRRLDGNVLVSKESVKGWLRNVGFDDKHPVDWEGFQNAEQTNGVEEEGDGEEEYEGDEE